MFEGGLALRLEGDNDKADKDVDHEEGDDDDVDEVEDGNNGPSIRRKWLCGTLHYAREKVSVATVQYSKWLVRYSASLVRIQEPWGALSQ